MGAWDCTLGIGIAGLPMEEWLFLVGISVSRIITYFCIHKFLTLNWQK